MQHFAIPAHLNEFQLFPFATKNLSPALIKFLFSFSEAPEEDFPPSTSPAA
jgi:hypothetical protein